MAPLADIAWDDPEIALPAFLTMAMIPLTFSIANGLAFGITAYALLKLLRGKVTWTDWLLLVLAAPSRQALSTSVDRVEPVALLALLRDLRPS